MNNWSQLEEQLRFWTPRAPSPNLKERLFGESATLAGAAAGRSPKVARLEWRQRPAAWHWLAPAMAVFLLGMFVVGRNSSEFESGSTAWAVSAIGHPQLSAYSAAMHHSDANSPPVTTIESTFTSTSEAYAPKAPPPMGQTNSLRQ